MRRRFEVGVLAAALALWAWSAAEAQAIALTGGTLQFYLGDPGSARLAGDGFVVASTGDGGWPLSVRPGDLVDFSTDVRLSNWGPAMVNGTELHGDPSGPGAGRVWISGIIHVAATRFVAPPPSGFTGLSPRR
jgi:hypothetical protein